jgi:hypothetical protein
MSFQCAAVWPSGLVSPSATPREVREFVVLAVYRSSNLGRAANIKMVREREAKFTASFPSNWRE